MTPCMPAGCVRLAGSWCPTASPSGLRFAPGCALAHARQGPGGPPAQHPRGGSAGHTHTRARERRCRPAAAKGAAIATHRAAAAAPAARSPAAARRAPRRPRAAPPCRTPPAGGGGVDQATTAPLVVLMMLLLLLVGHRVEPCMQAGQRPPARRRRWAGSASRCVQCCAATGLGGLLAPGQPCGARDPGATTPVAWFMQAGGLDLWTPPPSQVRATPNGMWALSGAGSDPARPRGCQPGFTCDCMQRARPTASDMTHTAAGVCPLTWRRMHSTSAVLRV